MKKITPKTETLQSYLALFLLLLASWHPVYAMVRVVAAENIYGNVVKQLGGPYVHVINILSNPAQDPHLFSINPSTAKAVKEADMVIMNGANYDPWMNTLLNTTEKDRPFVLIVSNLVSAWHENNPHLWYLPNTMPIFAQNVVKYLKQQDPEHQAYYEKQLTQFNQTYQAIDQLIKQLRARYQGTPVIATEPLFNYMASSIGLRMLGEAFQTSLMNDLPPSISEIKKFEDNLRAHRVFLLIYNKQVTNQLTTRMLAIAREENIPVVGMSEMMPNQVTYAQWMIEQLTAVDHALADSKHGQ